MTEEKKYSVLNSIQETGLLKDISIKNYEILFKTYYSTLCNFACKYLKDKDLAEEKVQDVFYKIWKNREQITVTISIKSYLYQSVKNICLQYLEHLNVERRYEKSIEHYSLINNFDPQDEMEINETFQLYDNTLNSLPTRCKEIFQLSRNEGLKYREIADKLSISIKTVEANIGKALQVFRLSFKKYSLIILFLFNL